MLMMLRSLSYGQQLQHSMATVAEKAPFLDLLESTLSRYKKGKVLSGPISIQPEGNIIFENPRERRELKGCQYFIGFTRRF